MHFKICFGAGWWNLTTYVFTKPYKLRYFQVWMDLAVDKPPTLHCLVLPVGIEPTSSAYKAAASPFML